MSKRTFYIYFTFFYKIFVRRLFFLALYAPITTSGKHVRLLPACKKSQRESWIKYWIIHKIQKWPNVNLDENINIRISDYMNYPKSI